MKQLIAKIRQFNQAREWQRYHSPKNLATALMIEAAELAEHFQWLTQAQSRNISVEKKQQIGEEIGDVLIYLANLADQLDIDPVAAAIDKMAKNEAKYPVSLARGNAQKYNEYN
jgi:NTP pyrophosphatase (non-canonical NTP hydrolase)